jgi:hypothetical protein
MGRILSKNNTGRSPQLAGPAEKEIVPDRLRIDGEIPTWHDATERFVNLVETLEESDIDAHRALDYVPFTNAWAGAAWSELYSIDQKAAAWAESTVLIRFSASYWLDKSERLFLPPVTYLRRLQASKDARQKALSRVLKETSRWQSIRVIGGTGFNGYPRVFLGLYLPADIEKSDFKPVLRAHINNCQCAGVHAHEVQETVSISTDPTAKTNLVHKLGQQIPGLESNDGIIEAAWVEQMMATALHSGRWRPYTFGRSI